MSNRQACVHCAGVEADQAAAAAQQEVVVVQEESEEPEVVEDQTAVVSVVEAGSQEVLHQVHFTMEVDGTTQEQQVRGESVHTQQIVIPGLMLSKYKV